MSSIGQPPSRSEADAERFLDLAHEKLDVLEVNVSKALVAVAVTRMKGIRSGSGFSAAGYHEPSYLYGIYAGWADELKVVSRSFPELKAEAEEAAQARFVADVATRGADAFEHPNVAKRKPARGLGL